jgi:hypothetical protein
MTTTLTREKKITQEAILDLNLLAKYISYYDQYDAVTEFLQELRSR